jgi:hypothetical protein
MADDFRARNCYPKTKEGAFQPLSTQRKIVTSQENKETKTKWNLTPFDLGIIAAYDYYVYCVFVYADQLWFYLT